VASIREPLPINYAENDERVNAMWPTFEGALKAALSPTTMNGAHTLRCASAGESFSIRSRMEIRKASARPMPGLDARSEAT
jgi:hypothetical protein